jgi:hypothetical protein
MSVARNSALALLHTLLLAAPAVFAETPPGYEPGEKWRTTMSMSAMGMTMPGMTNEVCTPKNAQTAPMEVDKNCKTLNHRRSGNRETFDMVCTGKDAMEGTMEITYLGKDHYTGKMIARTADGEMTMNYEGRKLPGECDAGAMKRRMDAMFAKANADIAKTCRQAAQDGQHGLFTGAAPMCSDPKDKQVFCSSAQGYKLFGVLSHQERYYTEAGQAGGADRPLTVSAKACGFGVDAKRQQLCGSAEAKGEWAFLAAECPALAKPLAQRECAGRGFTVPVAAKYQDFCSAYASARSGARAAGAAGGGEAGGSTANGAAGAADGSASSGATASGQVEGEDAPKKSVKDSLKKGTEKLKGLFGR